MKKNIVLVLAGILIAVFDLGLTRNLSGSWSLSILPLALLIVTLWLPIESALVVALVCGLVVDLSGLNRSLFTSVFLLSEVSLIYLSREKYLDFSNALAIFLAGLFFTLLYWSLPIAYYRPLLSLALLWPILANVILTVLVSVITLLAARKRRINMPLWTK